MQDKKSICTENPHSFSQFFVALFVNSFPRNLNNQPAAPDSPRILKAIDRFGQPITSACCWGGCVKRVNSKEVYQQEVFQNGKIQPISRWWFQILFYIHPYLGEMIQFDGYFLRWVDLFPPVGKTPKDSELRKGIRPDPKMP